MRTFTRTAAAATLAVGMMWSTTAVAAPVTGALEVGGLASTAVVRPMEGSWICAIYPRLPFC